MLCIVGFGNILKIIDLSMLENIRVPNFSNLPNKGHNERKKLDIINMQEFQENKRLSMLKRMNDISLSFVIRATKKLASFFMGTL